MVVVGTLMYLIEGEENGFTSIPTQHVLGGRDPDDGRLRRHRRRRRRSAGCVAAVVMILGYSIIAVPTGIVPVELAQAGPARPAPGVPGCGAEGHDADARHCKYCGARALTLAGPG